MVSGTLHKLLAPRFSAPCASQHDVLDTRHGLPYAHGDLSSCHPILCTIFKQ